MRFGLGHEPLQKHMGVEHWYHVAGMFREPTQRAISGWYHDRHDCEEASNIRDYAICTSACASSMLLGYECFDERGRGLSQSKRDQAVAHVYDMGFVGLTSEYDLSVCLLHAMFGGDCLPIEFANSRPGAHRSGGGTYDVGAHNLTDAPRGPDHDAYDAAKDVFWQNVKKYGVDRQACMERICPKAARFFEVRVDGTNGSLSYYKAPFTYNWPGRTVFGED